MTIAIAFFALFISLVALWLNGETMKKVSDGNDAIVKTHIKTLKDAIIESNKALNTLAKRVTSLEKDLEAAKMAQVKARETLIALQRRPRADKQPADQQQPALKTKQGAA